MSRRAACTAPDAKPRCDRRDSRRQFDLDEEGNTMAKMTMGRAVKRWWKYLAVKAHVMQDELADPKVQLEQAIQEAREQHQRLTEQAANVIANQRQAQVRLDRAVTDYEKADAMARQGLLLADRESRSGDPAKAARFVEAAEAQAAKAISLESQLRE